MHDVGIHAYGVYLPRYVMPRSVIAEQVAWSNPALKGQAKGERRFGNWDEDALTFAVAAARGLGSNTDRLVVASTTLPFLDRSNAGLVAEASGVNEAAHTADVGGSMRAATGALIDAAEVAKAGSSTIVVASDRRAAKPGEAQELHYGDGGVALKVDQGEGIARIITSETRHIDFVDHYRTADQPTDYVLEERWLRDAGVMEQVPAAIEAAVAKAEWAPDSIAHVLMPFPMRYALKVAAALGINRETVVDNHYEDIGNIGVAHPLLMLADVLERATAGDRIVVVGFGQGVDVILLETTHAVAHHTPASPLSAQTARRREERSYLKLPVFSGQFSLAQGIRAEADRRTAMPTYFRKHEEINRMMGSRCKECGQYHYPAARVCVNCGAIDAMERVSFADTTATVKSFTEDWLAASVAPPRAYGNVRFDVGGNAFLEFTDCDPGALNVGTRLAMAFRIKDFDRQRGFRRYCWKPVPADATEDGDA